MLLNKFQQGNIRHAQLMPIDSSLVNLLRRLEGILLMETMEELVASLSELRALITTHTMAGFPRFVKKFLTLRSSEERSKSALECS